MTDIRFHVYVPDNLAYSIRLIRKSLSVGARLCVLASTAERKLLSQRLWAAAATEFVPHAVAGESPLPTLARSAVVIATDPADVDHHDALLNLLPEVPYGFERFDRLIEVVGTTEEAVAAGRARWRYYQSRGYSISKHEVPA